MIPVLLAFIGLALLCITAEFLRRARWLERLALIAVVIMGIITRPSFSHHRIAVKDSIQFFECRSGLMMGGADRTDAAADVAMRLRLGDLLVLTFTSHDGGIASLGVFGRVFVFDRPLCNM